MESERAILREFDEGNDREEEGGGGGEEEEER